MNFAYLIAPMSGAVIGYITNLLAIKMLFRPRKAHYIGKLHIPFTPGLIPKEKSRLAESIGRTVASQLLDPATLSRVLLSDDMIGKFSEALDRLYAAGAENDKPLMTIASDSFGEENVIEAMNRAGYDISEWLYGKLLEADLPTRAGDMADSYLRNKSAGLTGIMVSLFAGNDMIREKVSDGVRDYINENGRAIITGLVEKESVKLMGSSLSDVVKKLEGSRDSVKEYAVKAYRSAVTEYLGKALGALDISKVITDKINSLNNEDLEKMILDVMNKELNAITWLGALLGGIMGFVNLII